MKRAIASIQQYLSKALNTMLGVFSTVQWGGRAYKLPGPGARGMKKPVLLAHVWIEKHGESIGVAFKLEPKRAKAMVRKHRWISPHSFRTLAPSGWIIAEIRTAAQCKTLLALLRESRAAHPCSQPAPRAKSSARSGKRASDAGSKSEAKRIDAALRRARDEGWRPHADAFDD